MTWVYFNGKFVGQRTTGVQRVAACLLHALDAQPGLPLDRWVLLCPAGLDAPPLRRIAVRHVGLAGLPLHLWEQFVLPVVARDGLLVNLAGAAPWFARRQTCMWHDAAFFDHPEAYARAFVLWYRTLFRRLAGRAERLFTVSAFSRARLALHLRLDPERIAIVTPGSDHLQAVVADDAVLARHGLVAGRYLLAVASDNPTKNLAALMMAYARLAGGPACEQLALVIVGGANRRVFGVAAGSAPEAVGDRHAADPPGVVRTGPLSDAALKALYQHALALVFPSLYEGFGLPPLEAMACGCPVTAARAAAIPEVCGEAALYFDPRSIGAITAALGRLAAEPALRARLREAGLARAAAFGWDASATALAGELRRLCGEGRSA